MITTFSQWQASVLPCAAKRVIYTCVIAWFARIIEAGNLGMPACSECAAPMHVSTDPRYGSALSVKPLISINHRETSLLIIKEARGRCRNSSEKSST